MTPIHYDSTDVGAPQIVANDSQTVLNVIKACLVGTAGVAYGSKASAGWVQSYDDTTNHKMVLRQGSGNQFYLRLGDSTVVQQGATSYGRRYLLARGYETMSSIDVGTGQFPTVAQRALANYYWAWANHANSATGSTVNIPWSIVADDRFFYIRFFGCNGINSTTYVCTDAYFFGDIVPTGGSDAFHTVIYGHSDTATSSFNNMDNPNCGSASIGSQNYHFKPFVASGALTTTLSNLYVARPFTQIGTSLAIGMHSDFYKTSDWFGAGNQAFPDQIDGGIYMTRAFVHENTGGTTIRGYLPGLWVPNHTRPVEDIASFVGTGSYSGINFISWRNARSSTDLDSFNVFFQLSDWRA